MSRKKDRMNQKTENKNVDNSNIVNELRNWEGEYHYPSGLLTRAADEIMRLRRQLYDLSWETNPDRMGR